MLEMPNLNAKFRAGIPEYICEKPSNFARKYYLIAELFIFEYQ